MQRSDPYAKRFFPSTEWLLPAILWWRLRSSLQLFLYDYRQSKLWEQHRVSGLTLDCLKIALSVVPSREEFYNCVSQGLSNAEVNMEIDKSLEGARILIERMHRFYRNGGFGKSPPGWWRIFTAECAVSSQFPCRSFGLNLIITVPTKFQSSEVDDGLPQPPYWPPG